MKPLFVAGCPRSGTTGFMRYLNRHPEILICSERYKFLPANRITPELFSFDRILDHRGSETNQPRQMYVKLLERKDPARLSWIGDKHPHYFKSYRTLAHNNRGARFIFLFRPVEEVAESFEARAADPNDRWPAMNGFATGVNVWNASLAHTRRFVEGLSRSPLLLVDYHSFFHAPDSLVPVLSRFLKLEFDADVRRSWAHMSQRFAESRRSKATLTAEQRALVDEQKDRDAESWALDYMRRQADGNPWERPLTSSRVRTAFRRPDGRPYRRTRSAVASALRESRALSRAVDRVSRGGRPGGDGALPPLPTFLIVGAQKGGTRWLRHNLAAHPDVFAPESEPAFFNTPAYGFGTEWYRERFDGWAGERAVGESTPAYTMPRQRPARSARRIEATLPGVRLLAVLRDPSERALSAFVHHMNEGRLAPETSLVEYVLKHPPEDDLLQIVTGGRYAANLAPYFERFGERLLVILNDDVRSDPGAVYATALAHLGVDADFVPDGLDRVRFSNNAPRESRYRSSESGRRTLSPEEREALYPYFAADLDRLEHLLGRDLSYWRPQSISSAQTA